MSQPLTLSVARAASSYPFAGVNLHGGEKSSESSAKPAVKVLESSAEPTVTSVSLKALKEVWGAQNLIFKPLSCLGGWIFTLFPTLTGAKEGAKATTQAKNLASGASIPQKSIDTVYALSAFSEKADLSNFAKLTNKVGLLVSSVIEVMRVFSDVVKPMAEATARTVSTVFNSALVFTTGYDTLHQLKEMGSVEQAAETLPADKELRGRVIAARDAQITQGWLKVGMNVSYFAIGALGLAVLFGQVTVAPWVILALATSGLMFTILGRFQKELVVEPALARVRVPLAVEMA